MKSGNHFFILIVVLAVMMTAGCVEPGMEIVSSSIPAVESNLTPFTVEGESFTLAWNPAEPEDVLGYNVYYRVHQAETWEFLTDSTEAELLITSAMLPEGDYEFAVSSFTATEESELHTSLDATANPDTGWYLSWIQ